MLTSVSLTGPEPLAPADTAGPTRGLDRPVTNHSHPKDLRGEWTGGESFAPETSPRRRLKGLPSSHLNFGGATGLTHRIT